MFELQKKLAFVHGRAAATGASMIILGAVMAIGANTASARDEVFAGYNPVPASELQHLRGGFITLNGAEITFGAAIRASENGTETIHTVLSFPAAANADLIVNGVGVRNLGPNDANVTPGPGGPGSVSVSNNGDIVNTPQFNARFPNATLNVVNAANDVNFGVINDVTIDIKNASALTGGMNPGAIRAVSDIANSLRP